MTNTTALGLGGADGRSTGALNSSRAGLALTAGAALALGFAQHVGSWAQRLGAAPDSVRACTQAAQALSLATSDGQVCWPLLELAASTRAEVDTRTVADWRRLLLASGVVGTPAAPGALPLLLDTQNRLYLRRYFDLEQRLAQRLQQAARAAPGALGAGAGQPLQALFDASPDIDWQQVAAALALRQRLCVISGGPGTGKTTTVVKLLALLLAAQPGGQAPLRVALAAPTGKAAARMLAALQDRASSLPAALRAVLPDRSFTVHRLLGVSPGGGNKYHREQPLPIDVLVVDEASMLDLALATQLLEAVPMDARIVLLGDKDQLAAVEAGAVFAELSANAQLSAPCQRDIEAACGLAVGQLAAACPPPADAAPTGALIDSAVWLSKNHRFAADSGIGRLAGHIQRGQASALLAYLGGPPQPGVRWLEDDQAQPSDATLAALQAGYAPYWQAVKDNPGDAARVHAAFNHFRALCAVQAGPWGVQAVNDRLAPPGQPEWYAGRAVMVLRNDPLSQLFNGDIGIALPDASAGTPLRVFFAGPDGGWRGLSPLRLPEHQTAFAMTVHKAQGSEFDGVLLLLPNKASRVLSRELLYTAVTRARQQVTLVGSALAITAAVQSATRRHSGLLDRLREAGDALPRLRPWDAVC
jgi:exodeoxyribonuclease V alpha subunit